MLCFYVYAPLYQKNSNGIRILYTLSELIREEGYESKVICYEVDRTDYDFLLPQRYKQHTIKANEIEELNFSDQDIVIYPETITDNPLNAKNVVRYLLNRPMYINGDPIDYGEKDYLVAYSLRVDSNLPQLFILNDDSEYFYPIKFQNKDNLVTFYYGKVIDPVIKDKKIQALIKTFDQKINITREFPSTRVELGDLLRKSRLLISLDPISNITYEATLCGTPSLLVDDVFGFSRDEFNIKLYGIFSDPTRYDEAIKDVQLATTEKKDFIDKNKKQVSYFIRDAIAHFELINYEVKNLSYDSKLSAKNIYLKVIDSRNKTQADLDQMRYDKDFDAKNLAMSIVHLNPFGAFLKSLLVILGAKTFFAKWYLLIKKWIKQNEKIATLFYRL